MKKKKNLPETPEKILSYVTPHRMAAWKKKAEEVLRTYLFVMSKRHRHIAWCSHCHHFIRLDVSRHREETACPHCGSVGEQIHGWRGYSRLHDRILTYTYSSAADGALVAVSLYAEAWWYKKGVMPWRVCPTVLLDSVSVFRIGEGGAMACPAHGRWPTAGCSLDHVMLPRYRGNNYKNMGVSVLWSIEIDEKSFTRAVKRTPFRYVFCAIPAKKRNEILRWDGAIRLLDRTACYSFAVECLAKMGKAMQTFLFYAAYNAAWGKVINWKGKTLRSVVRGTLTKEEKAWLHEKGEVLSPSVLRAWQELRKKGIQQTLLPEMVATGYSLRLYREVPDVAPARILHYLKKEQCGGDYYADYLAMCKEMNVDLTSKANLFPRNIEQAHEAAMGHVRTLTKLERLRERRKEAQGMDAAWEEHRAAIEKRYGFTADGITIRVPEKMEELIDEGNAMHNCVGTYVRRVASGSTIVVFIRTEDTDERLGTMEIAADGTHIVQARAAFNAALPQDVQAFVDKFEAEKINPIGMAG